ncbi:TPA: hypothetical protein DF272_02450 [Candidatus Falkowbacteria bacterium]|nr:hypothetical protein [Candidatus Falkowbacteria bacterium]
MTTKNVSTTKNEADEQKKGPFDQFTNLYELSKTLKFELQPVPETLELLDNGEGKNLIQLDKEIDLLYETSMKPLFDNLHEKFINDSLSLVNIDVRKLEDLRVLLIEAEELRRQIKEARKNKQDSDLLEKQLKELEGEYKSGEKKGRIPDLQKDLRGDIVMSYKTTAKNWTQELNGKETELPKKKGKRKIEIKKTGSEILGEENVLAILAYYNPDKVDIIKKFTGFFTYFSGFNQNRQNYYSTDALATSVAHRVINKNLLIFLENIKDYKKFKGQLPSLVEYDDYFKLKNFNKFLSQIGIEEYNEKIGMIKSIVNLEHNQKQVDGKFQLKGLKTFDKQIGCKTKKQRDGGCGDGAPKFLEKVGLGFQVTKDNDGQYLIWECLGYVKDTLEADLVNLRENYQKFFSSWQDYDLDKIFFRKEALNTISSRWFGGENWFIIAQALTLSGVGKIDRRDNEYKIPPFVSLQELRNAFDHLEKGIDFDLNKRKRSTADAVTEVNKTYTYSAENLFKERYKEQGLFMGTLFETMLAVWQSEVDYKFSQIFDGFEVRRQDKNNEEKIGKVESFLRGFERYRNEKFDKNVKDKLDRSIHVEIVKNLIEEGYLRLLQLTKCHSLEKKGEIDPRPVEDKFYTTLNEFWTDNIIVLYDKALQSTLTKKPYSEDKIKLNFENATLANGFDINKEADNAAVILTNEKCFYLAIMGKGNNYCFNKEKNQALYENIEGDW